jgi:hypothetical protein
MLVYAIETKTLAVGVGEGDAVGDALVEGDGDADGTPGAALEP